MNNLQFYLIDAEHFNRTNPDSVGMDLCPLKLVDNKVPDEFRILEFDQNGTVGSVVAHSNLWGRIDKRLMTKELLCLSFLKNSNLKAAIHIANYLGYPTTNATMDLGNLKTADQMSTISPEEGLGNYAQVRANVVDFFSKRFGW